MRQVGEECGYGVVGEGGKAWIDVWGDVGGLLYVVEKVVDGSVHADFLFVGFWRIISRRVSFVGGTTVVIVVVVAFFLVVVLILVVIFCVACCRFLF